MEFDHDYYNQQEEEQLRSQGVPNILMLERKSGKHLSMLKPEVVVILNRGVGQGRIKREWHPVLND